MPKRQKNINQEHQVKAKSGGKGNKNIKKVSSTIKKNSKSTNNDQIFQQCSQKSVEPQSFGLDGSFQFLKDPPPLVPNSEDRLQSKSFRQKEKQSLYDKISEGRNKNVFNYFMSNFVNKCFTTQRAKFFDKKFKKLKIKNSILKIVQKQKKKSKISPKFCYNKKSYQALFKVNEKDLKSQIKNLAMRQFAYKSLQQIIIPKLIQSNRVFQKKLYLYSLMFYQHRTLHQNLVTRNAIIKPK